MAGLNLKSSDLKAVGHYFSPRALNDLNKFLEHLPQNAGQSILIAAAVAWVFVAALGLFTTIKAQDLNNLRAQLQDAKALKPIVPTIKEVPVEAAVVTDFAKKLAALYKGLEIQAKGSMITINAAQTAYFGSFREAVIQTQNGGQGWKIGLKNMCVGRECKQKGLSITLKIDRISVDRPKISGTDYSVPASKPKK
jgi:hypothetical protein